MGEATTRSLFPIKSSPGAEEVYFIVDKNNIAQIIKNTIKNTLDVVNNMVSDSDDLNYTMALYNNIYVLRNPVLIKKFLESNKYLIQLVTDAHRELQKYFPPSSIFMEVLQNELVISVGTHLSPIEAKDGLDKFDDGWWLDKCEQSNAKMCITVEFQ
jgi:hypothetical protein